MAPDPTPPVIQRADPAARRRALGLFLLGMLVGLGCLYAVQEEGERLKQLVAQDPRTAARQVLWWLHGLGGLMALSLAGLAFWIRRLSAQIERSGRFPPPGMAVARDTVVLTGPAARRRAGWGYALATVMAVLAALWPFLVWRVGAMLTALLGGA